MMMMMINDDDDDNDVDDDSVDTGEPLCLELTTLLLQNPNTLPRVTTQPFWECHTSCQDGQLVNHFNGDLLH